MKFFRYFISIEFWGGVLASILASIILAIIEKMPLESVLSWSFIKSILTLPIPLYSIIFLFFLISVVLYTIKMKRKPGFLEITFTRMGGFDWHWRWVYDKKEKDYDMADFLPLCPKCGMELRMGIGDTTHKCINSHSYRIGNYLELKAQIKSTIRSKYPKDADKISVSNYIG